MGETAFFLIKKLLYALLSPSILFIVGVMVACALLYSRRLAVWGRRLLTLTVLCYVIFAVFPLGQWALSVLEGRFPAQTRHDAPVAGIIVLGGALQTALTDDYDQVQLNGGAERMTEFVRLARVHPEAKLLFSGGSGLVFKQASTEAAVAKRLFAELGLDPARVRFEDSSRNTAESAQMAFEKFRPGADERWVLITSARHMPRAVGLFRHAGWQVVAHPVDFVAPPGRPDDFWPVWPGRLDYINAAVYEWGGLFAAWLRGRTGELFPGPSQHPDAVAEG